MNYDTLFKPYTEDGHTVEATLKYLAGIAYKKAISNEVMEMAVNDIFLQIQGGKEFSKTECHCGCGINKSATDLIHSIKRRMLEIDNELTVELKQVMSQKWNLLLEARMKQISDFDKEYKKMMAPKKNGVNKLMSFLGILSILITPNYIPPPG